MTIDGSTAVTISVPRSVVTARAPDANPAVVRAEPSAAPRSVTSCASVVLSAVAAPVRVTCSVVVRPSAVSRSSAKPRSAGSRPFDGASLVALSATVFTDAWSVPKPSAVAPRTVSFTIEGSLAVSTSAPATCETVTAVDVSPALVSAAPSRALKPATRSATDVLAAVPSWVSVRFSVVSWLPTSSTSSANVRSAPSWPFDGAADGAVRLTSCGEAWASMKPRATAVLAVSRTMSGPEAVKLRRLPAADAVISVAPSPAASSASSRTSRMSVSRFATETFVSVAARDSVTVTGTSVPLAISATRVNVKPTSGRPLTGPGLLARSLAWPLTGVNCVGTPGMSASLTVPAVVPSVFHSSVPPNPAFAVK